MSGAADLISDPLPELVKDIRPGSYSGHSVLTHQAIALGDRIFFVLQDSHYGQELRVTDLASGSTSLVKDLHPGEAGTSFGDMVVCGDRLFFSAAPTNGQENPSADLWVTDGTEAGTQRLTDRLNRTGRGVNPSGLRAFNGRLIYLADDDTEPTGIWVTDGSRQGTQPLKRMRQYDRDGAGYYRYLTDQAVEMGGFLYFVPPDDRYGQELWKTDGTPAGTSLVKDLTPGVSDTGVVCLKAVGNLLYLKVDHPATGIELWKTDGTAKGTKIVRDIEPGKPSSVPYAVGEFKGEFYFRSQDDELWKTDGTTTARVQGSFTEIHSAAPGYFHNLGTQACFLGYDPGTHLYQVQVTDGTAAGTRLLSDKTFPSVVDSRIIGQRLLVFYRNSSSMHPATPVLDSVWAWDFTTGTAETLAEFTVVNPAQTTSAMGPVFHLGDRVLFQNQDELWTTDGTPGGTSRLMAGSGGSGPWYRQRPIHLGSRLLFATMDSSLKESLGITDGTAAGTTSFAGPYPSLQDSAPEYLQEMNGILYFSAHDGVHGRELWRSDGTDGGTWMVKDLWPGENSGNPADLQVQDGVLYFNAFANGITHGLWRSDGTAQGTRRLSEEETVTLDPVSPPAGDFHVEGGTRYYVTAPSFVNLMEAPVAPAVSRFLGIMRDYNPLKHAPKRVGDRLYFSLQHPTAGRELHSLDLRGRLDVIAAAGLSQDQDIVLTENGVLTFPPQTVMQPYVRTLTLHNRGERPITGLTFGPPDLDGYTLSPTSIPVIAPHQTVTVEVTSTPAQPGLRLATVQLTAMAGSVFTRILRLEGRCLGPADAPEVWAAPRSRIGFPGTPVRIEAGIAAPSAAGLTYEWKHNGKKTPLTGTVLAIPSLQAADTGSYTLTRTAAKGSGIPVAASTVGVAMVTPCAADFVDVAYKKPLTLTCNAAGPKSGLSYQWFFNGAALSDSRTTAGSRSSRLVIKSMSPSELGNYDCAVTLTAPDGRLTLRHGITSTRLVDEPYLGFGGSEFFYMLGEEIRGQMEIPAGCTLQAKGLPPGLTLSPTGLITGRVLKTQAVDPATGFPKSYRTTFTAYNLAGASPPAIVNWIILPYLAAGSFDGIIHRSPALDGGRGLGGKLKLSATAAGTISGQITLAGKTYRFGGTPEQVTLVALGLANVTFHVPRGPRQPPLKLKIKTQGYEVPVELQDENGTLLGTGKAARMALPVFDDLARPKGYAGYYTATLTPAPTVPDTGPHGSGYLTATVTQAGNITWKGKLADGTAITGGGFMVEENGPLGFPIHQDLYKLQGSLLGWMGLTEPGWHPLAVLDGQVTWTKAPLPAESPERSYKDGFPLQTLTITGVRYVKPTALEPLISVEAGVENNLLMTLLGGGLSDSYRQRLTLNSNNEVKPPQLTFNRWLKTLTLTPANGLFKGTFIIPHEDPALDRSATFEGVIIRYYAPGSMEGFFLLPDLPADGQPASALKTTPLRSGRIQLARP